MASPESIAAAFAKGMMEAMLGHNAEPKARKEKPVVVKTDDVQAAVNRYLDAQMAQADTAGEQQDLFAQPGLDLADQILARRAMEAAQARVEAREQAERDENTIPPGFYDPNQPQGSPWTSPARS